VTGSPRMRRRFRSGPISMALLSRMALATVLLLIVVACNVEDGPDMVPVPVLDFTPTDFNGRWKMTRHLVSDDCAGNYVFSSVDSGFLDITETGSIFIVENLNECAAPVYAGLGTANGDVATVVSDYNTSTNPQCIVTEHWIETVSRSGSTLSGDIVVTVTNSPDCNSGPTPCNVRMTLEAESCISVICFSYPPSCP